MNLLPTCLAASDVRPSWRQPPGGMSMLRALRDMSAERGAPFYDLEADRTELNNLSGKRVP